MGEWRSWIGRSTAARAFLDAAQANRMNATLDREPGFDDGDVLPPAWHWLYFHDVVPASRLGDEGHPALGETMPPVPLPRRMWAGGAFEFERPLHLGAWARRTSTISAITPKEGRSGSLFFVTVEHVVDVDEVVALREEQTIVYREMSPTGPAGAGGSRSAPDDADVTRRWRLDETALFRYSALTFNGHRIHYDVDYCRDVEGYPGLVVHGPLLATLLLDLAVAEGLEPRRFVYQARSPLCLPGAFTVSTRRDEQGAALWAAGADGGLAMTATVSPE